MEKQPGDLASLTDAPVKAVEKETQSTAPPASENDPAVKQETSTPAASTTVEQEDVPDPEEDDLDDLDDMLDEFSPSAPQPSSSGPGRPAVPFPKAPPPTVPVLPDGLSDEDFAAQLQAGMADLLGGLDTNPEMAAQFEKMLTELGGAGVLEEAAGGIPELDVGSTSSTTAKGVGGKAKPEVGAEDFQETIKKTMERMRTSGDQATAAAASDNTDDILAEMMKAMQSGEGGGMGSEEDFSKMLLGMMEQLTNKEILYEPMKELHDKFPEWMKKNEGKVDEADMKRYKEQQGFVKEIVERFELKTYKDENVDDREFIVERMQKMQAAGSPPADLVGDMAAAQEAFGAPEEGCPTQ